jgi:hypothetical protein
VSDSLINIIINTVKRGGGDKESLNGIRKLNAGFKELTGLSLGSVTAIGMAGAAVGGMAKFLKDSVNETVEYATEVDNLSRLLGISAEDTSRLIQASDDLFLSQEKLMSGLQAATRKGVDVSIEGLKKLADEYTAMPEGVERSTWVLQTFGRSGAEMGKLMEIGAAGIDEATAAIAKNLVITDQSMAEIMDYKRSIDNLNDSWQGVKYTVGTELIPKLDLLLRVMTKGKDAVEVHQQAVNRLQMQYDRAASAAALGNNSAKAAMEQLQDEIDALNDEFYGTEGAAGTAESAIVRLGTNTSTVTQYFKALNEEMIFNKLAANMTEDAALALAVQMGLLDPMTYSLSLKMDELTAKYDLNQDGVIDAKEATAEYYEEVKKLQDQVNNLQSKTIDIVVNWRGEGGGIGGAERAMNVDLNGNGIIGAANGLNFVVPPGFPNDSFGPIFVQSGEKVQVTPAGQRSGGNNINIHVHGAGDPMSVANEVMRRLRLQTGTR